MAPDTDDLDLLIITDLHYVNKAKHTCAVETRKASLGLELTQRALRWATRRVDADAIVLLGDLVDNGLAEDADLDWRDMAEEIRQFEKPVMCVPGNHDFRPEQVLEIFGDQAGAHGLKGCQIVTFVDRYDEGDHATRGPDALAMLRRVRADNPDARLIALQHNPIHPHIESSYPYHLTDNPEVMRTYSECGVTLSISGHYHPGQPLSESGGVRYLTAPALTESPFRLLHVRLCGDDVAVSEMSLGLEGVWDAPLIDIHLHSHYAYCDAGMQPVGAIERARMFGLGGIVFAEHAGHLYVPAQGYWSGEIQEHPSVMQKNTANGTARMTQYRAEMEPLRSDFVGLALEVDCDAHGGITLLDEDREGWDFFIGAVHRIPGLDTNAASAAEISRAFMDANERVLSHDVQVLAHPFRYFRRAKLPTPKELYRPLAQMIAQAGVAVEINYHTNEPDAEFFSYCLEEGAQLALGTDAHSLVEVAEMQPHLDLLRRLGYDGQQPLFTGK